MIAGTFTLEGMVVHFRMPDPSIPEVEVTTHDAYSGAEETRKVPSRAFAATLALAFDHEGMDGAGDLQDMLYAIAEPHQSAIRELRIIP